MNIFITGTDTNIGKTLVSSWLCLHLGAAYFKPIQTGTIEGRDSETVAKLSGAKAYPEVYTFDAPVSPHLAASWANTKIDIQKIKLPPVSELLIIEGAGGVLVPINEEETMRDLMLHLGVAVIVVARSLLGTINHTLLTLEALRSKGIEPLGVILSGPINTNNKKAIEHYGHTSVLAEIPLLSSITRETLLSIDASLVKSTLV